MIFRCVWRISPGNASASVTLFRDRSAQIDWSVKNQARMHQRNGDYPYTSTRNALLHWPETATAIAVRLGKEGLDITAPYGLSDLFELRLRPTPAFEGENDLDPPSPDSFCILS
ncbi:hypothetical protein B9P82_13400 [Citrobacter sp. L55]|nr:hypothetical protein B9P82_13400 [Citrobacter sp. L55]